MRPRSAARQLALYVALSAFSALFTAAMLHRPVLVAPAGPVLTPASFVADSEDEQIAAGLRMRERHRERLRLRAHPTGAVDI
jgi:hypothetical protein